MSDEGREQVRQRYAAAAAAATKSGRRSLEVLDCGPGCCSTTTEPAFGADLYDAVQQADLPTEAVAASLGLRQPDGRGGAPARGAGARPGLGWRHRRAAVGQARGLGGVRLRGGHDRGDAAAGPRQRRQGRHRERGVLRGAIEAVPLPDAAVDVVISNCVINLSTDKPAVIREIHRVLTTGGRVGVSDVVAEDELMAEERAERGSYVGCIAGALCRSEYLDLLQQAGFEDAEVEFTHEVAPGMHGAIVRARKAGA